MVQTKVQTKWISHHSMHIDSFLLLMTGVFVQNHTIIVQIMNLISFFVGKCFPFHSPVLH